MKTIHFRTTVIAGLALLGLAAGAAAQGRENLLTSIEVKRLVATAEPGDHALLRDHFAALADKYATKARRDTVMARTLTGNPNRRSGAAPGSKFTRLAEQATKSAAIARELAAHHERLAAGLLSTPPANSARFEAGEGAPAPTENQLRELAAGARTAADHRSLEEYYLTLAANYTKRADDHVRSARMYRASGIRSIVPAIESDRLAKDARAAAEKARAAAAEHRAQLAQIG